MLRISLVIPAFNEAEHIRACLDAVSRQTVRPFEVIVVDNNSTDETIAIARLYPFVRIVHEPRQGVVYARDAGFDAARGDVIGRIDVDGILPPDWIRRVQGLFMGDRQLHAVSGSISFYDVPVPRFFSGVDLFFRRTTWRILSRRNERFLYGGNMAVRRDFWQALRTRVCHLPGLHEDTDLAAHAAHGDWNIAFVPELRVGISAQRINSRPRQFWHYAFANSRTYRHHKLNGRFCMYPFIWLVLLFYPLLKVWYASYDPKNGRVSLRRLLRSQGRSRVSPVSDMTGKPTVYRRF